MKKSISIIFSFIIATVLIISYLPVNVEAAVKASTQLKSADSEYHLGDSFVVTFTMTSAIDIGFTRYKIEYDKTKLSFVPTGDQDGGNGTIGELVNNEGSETKLINREFHFTVIGVGSTTIQVTEAFNIDLDTVEEVETALGSLSLTLTEEAKSSNCNLKSITPSLGKMTPAFDPNVTHYTVNVPSLTKVCYINHSAEDKDAVTNLSGNEYLKVGTVTRTITVTAPDGTTKVYTIDIVRPADPTPEPTPTVKPTPTMGPVETVSPTNTPIVTPEPTVPSDPKLGDVDLDGDIFTIYDISKYLDNIAGTAKLKGADNFLYDSKVVFGIRAYEEGVKSQYLVWASKNGGSKQIYIFDTQEKTIQRFLGGDERLLVMFDLGADQKATPGPEVEPSETVNPSISPTPIATEKPGGVVAKPISSSLFFSLFVGIVVFAVIFIFVIVININRKY